MVVWFAAWLGPLYMTIADSLRANINFEFEIAFVLASNKNNYMGALLCLRQLHTQTHFVAWVWERSISTSGPEWDNTLLRFSVLCCTISAHFLTFMLHASVKFQDVFCPESHLIWGWSLNFKRGFLKIDVGGCDALRYPGDVSETISIPIPVFFFPSPHLRFSWQRRFRVWCGDSTLDPRPRQHDVTTLESSSLLGCNFNEATLHKDSIVRKIFLLTAQTQCHVNLGIQNKLPVWY